MYFFIPLVYCYPFAREVVNCERLWYWDFDTLSLAFFYRFLRKLTLQKCLHCWFSLDVTKIQTTKLSILLRFYFHGVLDNDDDDDDDDKSNTTNRTVTDFLKLIVGSEVQRNKFRAMTNTMGLWRVGRSLSV